MTTAVAAGGSDGKLQGEEVALQIFKDIGDSSKEVSDLVTSLKNKIDSGEYFTDEGISLLDVKNLLMAVYLINLTDILARKLSGKSIEGENTIERLVEIRVILERMRPIEQKLKYQIDKLLKVASTGAQEENDPSRFKANPAGMLAKDASSDESGSESDGDKEDKDGEDQKKKKAGIYVPPKLAAVHYDGDENENAKRQKLIDRARRHALNSSIMQELKEEYLDTPIEVSMTNSAKQREDKYQRYRQEYEESYMTRLPVTKEDRKRQKRLSTLGTLGDEITHFEDISVLEGKSDFSKPKKRKAKGKPSGSKKGKKKRKMR